jgi:hypothetical protein
MTTEPLALADLTAIRHAWQDHPLLIRLCDQLEAAWTRVSELETEKEWLREYRAELEAAIGHVLPSAKEYAMYESILAGGAGGVEPWAVANWQKWLRVRAALQRRRR